MTTDEAKTAFRRSVPVMHGGIRYDEISALIYRKNKAAGRLSLSLELADYRSRSVSIVPPENVEVAFGG